MSIHCAISLGELVDKITILEIKKSKIQDLKKVHFVELELAELNSTLATLKLVDYGALLKLKDQLKQVNSELWDIEDKIRVKEAQKDFKEEFIELARSVYIKNDQRFELKNQINISYQSGIREVKSYNKY